MQPFYHKLHGQTESPPRLQDADASSHSYHLMSIQQGTRGLQAPSSRRHGANLSRRLKFWGSEGTSRTRGSPIPVN